MRHILFLWNYLLLAHLALTFSCRLDLVLTLYLGQIWTSTLKEGSTHLQYVGLSYRQ